MEKNIFQQPLIKILVVILSLLLLALLVNIVVGIYQKFASVDRQKDTLTITATGEVEARPDVVQANFAVITRGEDPKTLQEENTDKVNQIIDFLKEQGIAEEDITTTSYNLYPEYVWTDRERVPNGYTLSQSVTVKIRDLEKVGDILAGVVEAGANNITSLNFQIDDPESLRQEARKLALNNAKIKAEELAKVAGVKLGKVKSFSEDSLTPVPRYPYPLALDAVGRGGSAEFSAPEVMPGTSTITATVSVTFELK